MDDGAGLNEAKRFDYIEPMPILREPAVLRAAVEKFGAYMSGNDRRKLSEEIVQAAAWCAGMSQLWKRPVRFSPGERAGSDCFLEIGGDAATHVGLLQLKQLPDESRSTVGLQELIDKAVAKRYNDPERLYIAFAVNRRGEYELADLKAEALREHVVEAWVYGRRATGRKDWFFYGDMLEDPKNWPVTIEDLLPVDRAGPG